jgi:hypothetical protein
MQSQDLAEVLAMLGLKQVAMLVLKGEIEEEFRALDAKLPPPRQPLPCAGGRSVDRG